MSLIWSKTLMELIFNLCGEFHLSPEGPISQIHSPHLHVDAPGIFSDPLRSVQMLRRECRVEGNKKLPQLFIPSNTATLVPAFAVKDLPLDIYIYMYVHHYNHHHHHQSVLPRSFTANSGTKAAVLPKMQVFHRKLRNQCCSFTSYE